MTRAQSLLDFYASIGLEALSSADGVPRHPRESLRDYQRVEPITWNVVHAITPDICLALCTAFGAALRVIVEVDDVVIEIDGSNPPTEGNLAEQLREARLTGEGGRLQISVEKTTLASAILAASGITDGAVVCVYYLFEECFQRLLDQEGLRQFDQGLFAGAATSTLVVVSDATDMHYEGEILSIVGEDRVNDFVTQFTFPRVGLAEKVATYRDARTKQLSWNFHLDRITPLHFTCKSRGRDTPALTVALRRHHFYTSVLYSATRVQRDSDERTYRTVYSEKDREAHLTLSTINTMVPSEAAVVELGQWPYEGEGRNEDRLSVLRKVFAQSLHEPTSEENASVFVASLPGLLKETRQQYDLFISGQLDKYFQQRQSAADYVADVAKKVADVVEGIVKGVGETVLATVAAVLTVLVAALSNDKLRGWTFSISLAAYAVYVAIQASYRMASAEESFRLLWAETTARLKGYQVLVSREHFKTFEGILSARQDQYQRWRTRTIMMYIFVLIVVLGLAAVGPSVPALQPITPMPTPSTVTTPVGTP